MNDPIHAARLSLARDSIDALIGNHAEKAAAFTDLAWALLHAKQPGSSMKALRDCGNPLVQKAAAHALADEVWDNGGADLAASYLASIAEFSILDALKRYARVLPVNSRHVMIAADAVGDLVAEGHPKPVKNLSLSIGDVEPTKAVGLVVLTEELATAAGPEGRRLFEAELAAAVTRASNASVLAALADSDTITVPGTGDPLVDLRAGLHAAGPSNGYVVGMPSGLVADLATRVENRGGMGVRGGTFVGGVEIVAVDDAAAITVIPASRIALWDGGLRVSSAEHATVDLRDAPESPANMVSLWQTNCLGLMLERSWHLAQADSVAVVELGS